MPPAPTCAHATTAGCRRAGYARLTANIDLVVDLRPGEAVRAIAAVGRLGMETRAPVAARDFADPEKRRGVDRGQGDARLFHARSSTSRYATALAGLRAVQHSVGQRSPLGDAGALLASIESEVAAHPERCFTFDGDGQATLVAAGHAFAAGRFTTPQIGELRARVGRRADAHLKGGHGRLLLSVLRGAHPLSDIGTLQATAAPRTLFQVASQFNCLEAPGPQLVPVRDYVHDYTQGPRASVSAFPGTFLRHYRAPAADGSHYVQTDARCIDLLADAVPASVARVVGGYLQPANIRDVGRLAAALEEGFDQLRIGAHAGVQVVFGHDWNGAVPGDAPPIAQAFTSTMALGGYGRDDGDPALTAARRQLLRAAYLGTLLAALDLDCDTVVLTMIGGGVFGNPLRDIWDAIHWALDEVEPLVIGTRQVIVNTREAIVGAEREKVRARGGVVVELGAGKVEIAL